MTPASHYETASNRKRGSRRGCRQRGNTASGLAYNIVAGGGASLLKIAIQLAMLPIMGRLLGPREFGLYATALPLVSFFSVIADGGLGYSLAREEQSRSIVWSTAFYAVLVLAIIIVALVNAFGFVLSALTHEPRLSMLMSVLSISFVFIGFSVLPSARLVRYNDLVTGAVIDIVASIVGAIVAIVAATHYYGAFSLALQFVSGYGIRGCALNLLAFERPRWEFSLSTLAPHVSTGGVLVGGRLLDLVCRFAENLLITLTFGVSALGEYTFANQVSRFMSEAASNPVWSALYAQAIREKKAGLQRLFLSLTRLMCATTLPAACLIAASAAPLLAQVLGSKWVAAAPLLQILAPSFAIASTASLGGAVLLAIGRNKWFLATFGVLSVGRVIAVSLGHWVKLLDVTVALGATHLLYLLAMLIACHRSFGLSLIDFARSALPAFVAALLAGGIAMLMLSMMSPSLPATVTALAGGAVTFLIVLCILERGRVIRDFTLLAGPIGSRIARLRPRPDRQAVEMPASPIATSAD